MFAKFFTNYRFVPATAGLFDAQHAPGDQLAKVAAKLFGKKDRNGDQVYVAATISAVSKLS